jgi:hypothetical protein
MYPTTTAGKFVGSFAMLAGVLVLAFPVSVFSDLWSEELKQSKGFKDLYRDDDNDDDNDDDDGGDDDHGENDGTPGTSNRKKKNVNNIVGPERDGRDGIMRDNYNNGRRPPPVSQWRGVLDDPLSSSSSPYVVMERSDLNQIVASLHEIRENQTQIRTILRKYCMGFDVDAGAGTATAAGNNNVSSNGEFI